MDHNTTIFITVFTPYMHGLDNSDIYEYHPEIKYVSTTSECRYL